MKLKQCPFCGGDARFASCDKGKNTGGEWVECTHCNACSQMVFPTKDDVKRHLADMWNCRVKQTEDDLADWDMED